jgi:hypothetical protein
VVLLFVIVHLSLMQSGNELCAPFRAIESSSFERKRWDGRLVMSGANRILLESTTTSQDDDDPFVPQNTNTQQTPRD